MDVKLDMELDMKISHGHAREEREECARGEEEVQPVRRGRTGPHADAGPWPVNRPNRRQPEELIVRAKPETAVSVAARLNRRTGRSTRPDSEPDKSESVSTRSLDIITWREYEALRNEMRREFRTRDDELKGTVDEIKQTLEATNVTVTGLADQMTDIQRNIADMRLAIENLTAQQQQKTMMKILSLKMTHTMLVVRLVVIVLVAGFHLAAMVVDKMKKMDWLKIEKLWSLHPNYSEDKKIKLASSEFDGYALRWWDSLVPRNRDMLCHTCGGKGHFKRDCPNRKVMFINEDNEYETGDDVDPNAPDDDDYDTDGEDAYPSDARTIVVSQRALNVLPSASTQRCNLFQTKALVGPDKSLLMAGVAAI
ncbi:hypothetical protein QYE76_026612 [Lolium multiflorum]|uniref:CCHC-type domain-containing protein n=1 Tax=Lolium multiflorum TaxID=4521 RepID=A0AAD8VXR3_LOLMU|nr:hypothetical protein QYE76_026612 [Lolium multiflorum]